MNSKRKKAKPFYEPDDYGIVHLDGSSLVIENAKETLSEIIHRLRDQSRPLIRGAWLTLRGEKELSLILEAFNLGFRFHHAQGETTVMGIWLHDNEPNTLPKGATHTIGVGCMVVDKQDEKVLMVTEKHGPARGWWKMVTGLVEQG
jgi:hypothetical protein